MPVSGSKMGTAGWGPGTKDNYKKPSKGTKTFKVGKGGKWPGASGRKKKK